MVIVHHVINDGDDCDGDDGDECVECDGVRCGPPVLMNGDGCHYRTRVFLFLFCISMVVATGLSCCSNARARGRVCACVFNSCRSSIILLQRNVRVTLNHGLIETLLLRLFKSLLSFPVVFVFAEVDAEGFAPMPLPPL